MRLIFLVATLLLAFQARAVTIDYTCPVDLYDEDTDITNSCNLGFEGGNIDCAWDATKNRVVCTVSGSGTPISYDTTADGPDESTGITHLECSGNGMSCTEPVADEARIALDIGSGATQVAAGDHTHVGGGTHNLLDGTTHPDTIASGVTRGDIIIGNAAGTDWDDLAVGPANSYLGSDGTDPGWLALEKLYRGADPNQIVSTSVDPNNITYDFNAKGGKDFSMGKTLRNLPVRHVLKCEQGKAGSGIPLVCIFDPGDCPTPSTNACNSVIDETRADLEAVRSAWGGTGSKDEAPLLLFPSSEISVTIGDDRGISGVPPLGFTQAGMKMGCIGETTFLVNDAFTSVPSISQTCPGANCGATWTRGSHLVYGQTSEFANARRLDKIQGPNGSWYIIDERGDNGDCLASGDPYTCCTGAGTGTCNNNVLVLGRPYNGPNATEGTDGDYTISVGVVFRADGDGFQMLDGWGECYFRCVGKCDVAPSVGNPDDSTAGIRTLPINFLHAYGDESKWDGCRVWGMTHPADCGWAGGDPVEADIGAYNHVGCMIVGGGDVGMWGATGEDPNDATDNAIGGIWCSRGSSNDFSPVDQTGYAPIALRTINRGATQVRVNTNNRIEGVWWDIFSPNGAAGIDYDGPYSERHFGCNDSVETITSWTATGGGSCSAGEVEVTISGTHTYEVGTNTILCLDGTGVAALNQCHDLKAVLPAGCTATGTCSKFCIEEAGVSANPTGSGKVACAPFDVINEPFAKVWNTRWYGGRAELDYDFGKMDAGDMPRNILQIASADVTQVRLHGNKERWNSASHTYTNYPLNEAVQCANTCTGASSVSCASNGADWDCPPGFYCDTGGGNVCRKFCFSDADCVGQASGTCSNGNPGTIYIHATMACEGQTDCEDLDPDCTWVGSVVDNRLVATREETDCDARTDGVDGEICCEANGDCYRCDSPDGTACDAAAEWDSITKVGAATNTDLCQGDGTLVQCNISNLAGLNTALGSSIADGPHTTTLPWDDLTAPDAATTFVSNSISPLENITFDFQANYTTGALFQIATTTGNPSGGTLLSVSGHDPDVIVARLTGSAGNGVELSAAGVLAPTGAGPGVIQASRYAKSGVSLTNDVDLGTTEVAGILDPNSGGTGLNSLTDGGILLGSGLAAVTVTAQPTNGQILIGSTGSDPTLQVMSGDVAMTSGGVVTIQADAIDTLTQIDAGIKTNDGAGANDRLAIFTEALPAGNRCLEITSAGALVTAAGVCAAAGSGDISDVGPGYADGAAFTDGKAVSGTTMLVWEGITPDANQYNFLVASNEPGGARNITFQDASGIVAMDATAVTDLEGQGLTIAGGILGCDNAVDDGATKGCAAFTAADFNAASGVISIDDGTWATDVQTCPGGNCTLTTGDTVQLSNVTLTGVLPLVNLTDNDTTADECLVSGGAGGNPQYKNCDTVVTHTPDQVGTVNVDEYCQGGAGSVLDCDVTSFPKAALPAAIAYEDEANSFDSLQTIAVGPTTALDQALLIDQDQPGVAGTRDSDYIEITGTSFDASGHDADWRVYADVTSNAGASQFTIQNRIDAAGFATLLFLDDTGTLDTTGSVDANTGFRVAGAAATGNYLRGNGTNFVSSAILSGDLPATVVLDTESPGGDLAGTYAGPITVTDLTITSEAQGDLLMRGATSWNRLADSGTASECLLSGGAGGDPAWGTCPGGGGGDDITVQSAFGDPVNPIFNDTATINVTATDAAPDTVTWDFLPAGLTGTTTWGAGASQTWVWNAGVTDPQIVFASDSITVTNAATITLPADSVSDAAIGGILADELISLTSEVTGTLPAGNGGTGTAAPTEDAILVGETGGTWNLFTLTNGALKYDTTGDTFSQAGTADLSDGAAIILTTETDQTIGDNTDPTIIWAFDPSGTTNPAFSFTDGVINVSAGALQVATNAVCDAGSICTGAVTYEQDTHATEHQNGGADEVATATPAANAIPKAEADGDINVGWIPLDASYTWAGTHDFSGATVTIDMGTNGTLNLDETVAPTDEGRIAWDPTNDEIEVGNGVPGTDIFKPVGTFTNANFCTADTTANEIDCGTSGSLADDDLSDDLITALSGVTTVTDGSYCQGGTSSSMDCDQTAANVAAAIDSETMTLTATTLDVEGGTNAVTLIQYLPIPAATCIGATATLNWDDDPVAVEPGASCVSGTNVTKGTADFADATDECMQVSIPLVDTFTGSIDVTYHWIANATTGAAGWCSQILCQAETEADEGSFPAHSTSNCVSDTTDATANDLNVVTDTAITATCNASEMMHIRVCRDGDGTVVTDSLTVDARLISATYKLRSAQ